MKTTIQIPIHVLRAALAGLYPLVNQRTSLPILSRVLIEQGNGVLRFAGNDLDIHLSYTHRLEPEPITPLAKAMAAARWKGAGVQALTVPPSALKQAVQGARNQLVNAVVTLTEDRAVWPVVGGEASDSFTAISPAEFPPCRESPAALPLALGATARAAVTAAACCSSEDETRYVLMGILFSGGDEKTAAGVVATDGRRLYREPVPALSGLGGDFIVPNKVLDLLGNAVFSADWQMGFLPGVEADLKAKPPVQGCAPMMRVQCGQWDMTARLIDGFFPNYRQVIPLPDPTWMGVALLGDARERLQKVLSQLPKAAACLTLGFTGDTLRVVGSPKGGSGQDDKAIYEAVVPGVLSECPFVIRVNPPFFRALVATGEGHLWLLDEVSPLYFKAFAGAEYVVMPMRGGPPMALPDAEREALESQWKGAAVKVDKSAGTVKGIVRNGKRLVAVVNFANHPSDVDTTVQIRELKRVAVKKAG